MDTVNSLYIDCTEDLLVQNESYINGQTAQMIHVIQYSPDTKFGYPVTENELNQVVSKLKDVICNWI